LHTVPPANDVNPLNRPEQVAVGQDREDNPQQQNQVRI